MLSLSGSALQLERDQERVVVVAWLLQPRERQPGPQGDADEVGQGQMMHADPGADPLAEPGAAMVPAPLPIAGVEQMRSGRSPLHEGSDEAGMVPT